MQLKDHEPPAGAEPGAEPRSCMINGIHSPTAGANIKIRAKRARPVARRPRPRVGRNDEGGPRSGAPRGATAAGRSPTSPRSRRRVYGLRADVDFRLVVGALEAHIRGVRLGRNALYGARVCDGRSRVHLEPRRDGHFGGLRLARRREIRPGGPRFGLFEPRHVPQRHAPLGVLREDPGSIRQLRVFDDGRRAGDRREGCSVRRGMGIGFRDGFAAVSRFRGFGEMVRLRRALVLFRLDGEPRAGSATRLRAFSFAPPASWTSSWTIS